MQTNALRARQLREHQLLALDRVRRAATLPLLWLATS
jgi:hypothetical protein